MEAPVGPGVLPGGGGRQTELSAVRAGDHAVLLLPQDVLHALAGLDQVLRRPSQDHHRHLAGVAGPLGGLAQLVQSRGATLAVHLRRLLQPPPHPSAGAAQRPAQHRSGRPGSLVRQRWRLEQRVQLVQQHQVAGAGDRRQGMLVPRARQTQGVLLEPGRHRAEHQLHRFGGDDLLQARQRHLCVAHLRQLGAQPLELTAERIGRSAVEHRAGSGGDAAQTAGGDLELVDGVGPVGPHHHVRRLQRGDLRPDGIEHDVSRLGPVLPRRRLRRRG